MGGGGDITKKYREPRWSYTTPNWCCCFNYLNNAVFTSPLLCSLPPASPRTRALDCRAHYSACGVTLYYVQIINCRQYDTPLSVFLRVNCFIPKPCTVYTQVYIRLRKPWCTKPFTRARLKFHQWWNDTEKS